MRGKVHHAALVFTPGGEQRVRAFYGELLNLEELEPETVPRHSIWFKLADDVQLHLFADQAGPSHSRAHLCLTVDDLTTTVARLRERGYDIEVAAPLHGRERIFTRDPFANRLELTADR